MEALITLSGVGVRLGGREVLTGIDLKVTPGEIVTVVGPNGSGKTTLARVVLGVVRPDRGAVHRQPGLTIGYVPQRTVIDPVLPLSVGRLLTLSGRAGRQGAAAALEEVGAAGLSGRQVEALSGGELQRVLLARALIRDPRLLVLDEPTQNVDWAGQGDLYRLIARIRDRRGCGVLMISHDLHVVMAATDRVICLNVHVCCEGTPAAVGGDPAWAELFGPGAAAALAVYAHDHHHHRHDLAGEVVGGDAKGG
jgi:zinc transport system ATP-binding protein